jgi:hypothetical protein
MPSGGGTTNSKTGVGGGLGKPISGGILEMLGGGQGRDAGMNKFFMDPAAFQGLGNFVGKSAMGGDLDVANTPQGSRLINAINQNSQQQLGENLAGLRSRFALAGHTSTGGSAPLLQAQTQAINQEAKSRESLMAESLFNMFNQERARQLASQGAFANYQQTPLNITAQLAPLFSKGSSTVTRANPVSNFMGK